MRKLIMWFAVAAVTFGANAGTVNVGGVVWTYTVSDGKASVGGGSNSSPAVSTATAGSLAVPEKLGGYPVASIGKFAFFGCSQLTSVTIPDGVTSIGDEAFENCSRLTSVTIPDSVVSIGFRAFYNSSVTSVKIPASMTQIGSDAFSCCRCLKSMTIPEGVTSIGWWAFYQCSQMTSVTIPSSVQIIHNGAFVGCKALTEVVIPDGVTTIESWVFESCSGMKYITIPASVTSIGEGTFGYCNNLAIVYVDAGDTVRVRNMMSGKGRDVTTLKFVERNPESKEDVGGLTWTFTAKDGQASVGSHSSLAIDTSTVGDVVIPNRLGDSPVTSIGVGAFVGCAGLTSVTIPDGVVSIGDRAFSGCSGLTSVTIPASVESIGDRVFDGCANIVMLNVDPRNATYRVSRGRLEAIGGKVILDCSLKVSVLSSQVRENDPTIIDVTYKVRSLCSAVRVRVLAFEDGQRSFAKVVRPETFVDGTGENIGENIEPNVVHTISWRVSNDWATKLAKVKFEVLASEGGLLPLETMTIPASDQYGKMKITWNAISENQVFDALLWLYASKDSGLALTNGQLKNNAVLVANGSSVSAVNAMSCILSRMGYSLLTGDPLVYANQETRLGLSPSGTRQYGYKIVEE